MNINVVLASKGITSWQQHTVDGLCPLDMIPSSVTMLLSNNVQVAGEACRDWAVVEEQGALHQFTESIAHAMVSGMAGVLTDVALPLRSLSSASYIGIN